MPQTSDLKDVLDALGGPAAIESEARALRRSTRLLSSNDPRMIDQYPNQWVGIYDGKVQAHGDSFDQVLSELDRLGIPKNKSIIRYLTRYRRAMFL